MSNKMSLREISSSHVKAFEQICFIRILKQVSQQLRKIYVHGNSNRLLEDLIPKTTMILSMRISSVAFYINFRVLVCRIRMVSNKIGFIMTYNYI